VPVRKAAILAIALLLLGLALQAVATAGLDQPGARRLSLFSWLFLLAYFLMNLAYSRRLKQVAILDVSILTAGFLLRLMYGAALTGIAVSGWLYLTVLTMSFYMGLGKRRGELLRQTDTRQVLRKYSQGFLDKSMNMCLTLTVAFYSLWAGGGGSIAWGEAEAGGAMLWTVPLVMVICLKYSLAIEENSDGDPVEVILGDKVLCGLLLLFALLVFVLLY
jgi:4-hydroxybenzoate polyprenyltransferase